MGQLKSCYDSFSSSSNALLIYLYSMQVHVHVNLFNVYNTVHKCKYTQSCDESLNEFKGLKEGRGERREGNVWVDLSLLRKE